MSTKLPTEALQWPVEARISHRIMIYAAQSKPHMMNQFTIEDIVREEMARSANPPQPPVDSPRTGEPPATS